MLSLAHKVIIIEDKSQLSKPNVANAQKHFRKEKKAKKSTLREVKYTYIKENELSFTHTFNQKITGPLNSTCC